MNAYVAAYVTAYDPTYDGHTYAQGCRCRQCRAVQATSRLTVRAAADRWIAANPDGFLELVAVVRAELEQRYAANPPHRWPNKNVGYECFRLGCRCQGCSTRKHLLPNVYRRAARLYRLENAAEYEALRAVQYELAGVKRVRPGARRKNSEISC